MGKFVELMGSQMHSIMVIAAGLSLLGAGLIVARMIDAKRYDTMVAAAKAFIPVWCILSLINLWVGVAKAGYPLSAEAPIFLVVFGIPAVVAFLTWRKLSGLAGTSHQ